MNSGVSLNAVVKAD